MTRFAIYGVCLLPILLILPAYTIRADESPNEAQVEAADRMLQVFESVLETHIAPPTRQEMLLRGCRAIVAHEDLELQANLARQISDLRGRREMAQFLATLLPPVDHSTFPRIEATFITSGLTAVPGGVRYSGAKEYAVQQQLRENRYVGIGIVLAKDGNYPFMPQVIPGGPAHRAGGRNGDRMILIDDKDATQLSVPEIIEILRGQEGKPVSIVVKQPNSDEERTLAIVRGEVPLGSVEGLRRDSNDAWVHRVSDESDVAYVKVTAIRGSTARELKQTARRLHAEGFRALILDLQAINAQGELRHAVMIANELLGEGKIGAVVRAGTRKEFASSADQLFAAWPMVVLIGARTQGQGEWIAAALQDNGRAMLMGQRTLGAGFVQHAIVLDNGDAIEFRGGVFERGSGESLVSRGRISEMAQVGGELHAMAGQFKRSSNSQDMPEGWKGVQPDQLVTSRHAVDKAVAFLGELLQGESADASLPPDRASQDVSADDPSPPTGRASQDAESADP